MRSPRVVAIIQARLGSTRLPGKVLAPLAGASMLARVCRRVARAMLVDEVLVATTRHERDDAIVDECARLGFGVFRGSEHDVLDRYYHAAQAARADLIVRVTSDCPLIDPGVIDRVVRAMLSRRGDYAANVLMRTFPRGLDTEVVTARALERAWRDARESYERVHVMPYFYRHPEWFRLVSVTGPHELGHWRWTVDSPEDLAFVREIYQRMNGQDDFTWRDVRRLLERQVELTEINAHVPQKQMVEG